MEARKHFSRIGWAYAVFGAVSLAVQLLGGLLIRVLWPDAAAGELDVNVLMLFSEFCMYVIAFPVFRLMIMRIPAWHKEEQARMTVGHFLVWTVVSFGMTYIGNIVGQIMMSSVSSMSGRESQNLVQDLTAEMDIALLFVTTVIIAPVMEELMFRKYLVDRLVPYGQLTAVLFSAAGFGLFHANFYQFFYAFALGALFAYIYSSTGRIRYTILLHMLVNLMGGPVSALLLRWQEEHIFAAVGAMLLWGLFMVLSMVFAIVMFALYIGKLHWFEGWAEDRPQSLWRAALTAPGVLAFLVICGAMFLLS